MTAGLVAVQLRPFVCPTVRPFVCRAEVCVIWNSKSINATAFKLCRVDNIHIENVHLPFLWSLEN